MCFFTVFLCLGWRRLILIPVCDHVPDLLFYIYVNLYYLFIILYHAKPCKNSCATVYIFNVCIKPVLQPQNNGTCM
ncbi:unnamed protein product [Acanthoscelides obtectus]|uniref:Uncharacterized protein n=1 Tax=Acanthoscelides obtectus TaxID=200917 RepID=A0A9P0LPZ9_ACAOB|nr:unnamed protein product [Acanthoscelides obtectus]CAK1681785.1 hypothetical protein AOBTE_LOCUS33270 [Acanthoscelides obtectus]